MKALLIALLALGSISAFAGVCEVKLALAQDASHIKIYMEDKATVDEEADEIMIAIMDGNPDKLNCEELIKKIKKSGRRTADIDGEKIPLQIIHTFNL